MSYGYENLAAARQGGHVDALARVEGKETSPDTAPVTAPVTTGTPSETLLDAAEFHQTLSPELGQMVLEDFTNFVKGRLSEQDARAEGADNEDRAHRTFNDMDNEELMMHLFEYLGSGVVNVNINSALIEEAQRIIIESTMSEEELAELPDPKTEQGKAARQKLLIAKMQEIQEQQEELAERRAKWDAEMHKLGDREYSGAELHAAYEWLKDENNQELLENEIMSQTGVSRDEAKRRRTQYQEYLELMERKRNDGKLSAADENRLTSLQNNPEVQQDAEISAQMQKRGMGLEMHSSIKSSVEADSQSASQNFMSAYEEKVEEEKLEVSNKVAGFTSYAKPPIESGIAVSDKFQKAATGNVPDVAPIKQQLAASVAIADPLAQMGG